MFFDRRSTTFLQLCQSEDFINELCHLRFDVKFIMINIAFFFSFLLKVYDFVFHTSITKMVSTIII